jgi:hypothetical protein
MQALNLLDLVVCAPELEHTVIGGDGLIEPTPSDARLKTDISRVRTAEGGVNIYAFRYRGDDRLFEGVIAQELLENPRLAHAVTEQDGFLAVCYDRLGIEVAGRDQMAMAGLRAARLVAAAG